MSENLDDSDRDQLRRALRALDAAKMNFPGPTDVRIVLAGKTISVDALVSPFPLAEVIRAALKDPPHDR